MINARIAQIDHLISLQLNEVMHAPELPEAGRHAGAGCKYLLDQSETSDKLKIKVLNVSKKDLLRDLQRAPEFDQSALFKKVYEEEFGVFGGAPFGALIGDYEFGKRGRGHRAAGEGLAGGGGGARAVPHGRRVRRCSTWRASPSSTRRATWRKIFDTTEYAKWKSFRADARTRATSALTLPRILMRAAVRQGHRAGRGVRLRGGRGRHRPQQVPVGQRGLGAGARG